MSTQKPFSFEPMLCESAKQPPDGREWRYELKLDGFRAIGRKSGRSTRLRSRNQKDFTRRFPGVVKSVAELSNDTVIDGEIVPLDENGKPSFNLLQGFDSEAPLVVLNAFDLFMLRGKESGSGLSKNAANSFMRSFRTCRTQSDIRRHSKSRCQN